LSATVTSPYPARYRAARAYAGLSQEALGDELGLDKKTIMRRENGKQEGKAGERAAVAAICGVPPEFMERGWDTLQPSEIRVLLDQQTQILGRIENAVDPLRRLAEAATRDLEADAPAPASGDGASRRSGSRETS
jgi:transcriptional regulator with XRE-family HTH domain